MTYNPTQGKSHGTVQRAQLRAVAADLERAGRTIKEAADQLRWLIGDAPMFPPGTWVGSEQKHIDEQQAKIDGLRKQAEEIITRIDEHLSRR